MKKKLFDLIATEALAGETGKAAETEVVIYCKITNFEGLKQSGSREDQHQVEGSFATGVRCRVRKTTIGTNSNYVFTFKVSNDQEAQAVVSRTEYNVPVDEDFFEGFRTSAANKAVKKTRYKFHSNKAELKILVNGEENIVEVPDLIYEVDVYYDTDGFPIEWCKIDVEVDSLLAHISERFPGIKDVKLNLKVNHLPFHPVDPILTSTMNDQQQQFVSQLWESCYNQAP